MRCPPFKDRPDLNLYLRDYHPDFMIGSSAVHECSAGYYYWWSNHGHPVHEAPTSDCTYDRYWTWSARNPNPCHPLTCKTAPHPSNSSLHGSMNYAKLLHQNMSLVGTMLRYQCPPRKFFVNRIAYFDAECGDDKYGFPCHTPFPFRASKLFPEF